jgi:hypothetical protein
MGYLSQASSGASVSTKLTLSMLVELPETPASGFPATIISWGNMDATNDPIRGYPNGQNSFVGLSSGPVTVDVQIRSLHDVIHAFAGSPSDNYIGYAPGGGTTTQSPDGGGFQYDIYTTAIIFCSFDFSDFVPGQRYHVLVALDVSADGDLATEPAGPGSDFPYSYRFTGKCFINGTNRSVFSDSLSLEQDDGAVADGTLPIWPIAINSQQVALPGLELVGGVVANNDGAVKVGNVLVWTDYIDPDAHIDKFFRDGNPVNPEEAIAAFGTPDYDIRGPAATVTTNLGSAGDFVKTGTATDAAW